MTQHARMCMELQAVYIRRPISQLTENVVVLMGVFRFKTVRQWCKLHELFLIPLLHCCAGS